MFAYHWLYLLAPVADLVDASGRQLFLSSEDVTSSYASSFCVSHRNPQLKRKKESTKGSHKTSCASHCRIQRAHFEEELGPILELVKFYERFIIDQVMA